MVITRFARTGHIPQIYSLNIKTHIMDDYIYDFALWADDLQLIEEQEGWNRQMMDYPSDDHELPATPFDEWDANDYNELPF